MFHKTTKIIEPGMKRICNGHHYGKIQLQTRLWVTRSAYRGNASGNLLIFVKTACDKIITDYPFFMHKMLLSHQEEHQYIK